MGISNGDLKWEFCKGILYGGYCMRFVYADFKRGL